MSNYKITKKTTEFHRVFDVNLMLILFFSVLLRELRGYILLNIAEY
jgi:hypothetical protein